VGDRETILGEIARQQAVLDRLEQEREQVRERLRALEGSLGDGTPSTESVTAPVTSAEKIALFRRLFRGCDDGKATVTLERGARPHFREANYAAAGARVRGTEG
jgi:hypothetical protein